MRRRDFVTLLGGAAAAWPITASAQQPALPVIAFVNARSPDNGAPFAAAFRKGLGEAGYVDGQNVILEYHWLGGRYDQLSELMADLERRRVAVIATPGSNPAAVAAKAATTVIPIVFGVGVDPVKLGLVESLARPGGNVTGVNFFVAELTAKRLGLLHELVPKAARIAVLVNPSNAPVAESTARDVPEAARALGLQIAMLKASTGRDIEAAFATLVREPANALLVAPDGFFSSRRVEFALLAARHAIPAAYGDRDYTEVGGLMSYGTDIAAMYGQVGNYCGRLLKGGQARRPASHSVHQVRVRHQPADRQDTWPRRAADVAGACRRHDRVNRPSVDAVAASAHGRLWHECEVPTRAANVG